MQKIILLYFQFNFKNIFLTNNRRSIAIIKEEFNSLLSEQDFLGTTEQCNKILSFIADEKLKEQINLQFSKYQGSIQRWEALTVVVDNNHKRVNVQFITYIGTMNILNLTRMHSLLF